MAVVDRLKGTPVSTQRILSWISCLCYHIASVTLPSSVVAHLMRKHPASKVYLTQVPIQDICRAATWSSVHILASHYAISQRSRYNARFGGVVVQSLVRQTPTPPSEFITWIHQMCITWSGMDMHNHSEKKNGNNLFCNSCSRCAAHVHSISHPPTLYSTVCQVRRSYGESGWLCPLYYLSAAQDGRGHVHCSNRYC